MKIRPTLKSDIPALQEVLDATELFPSEMLPDMLSDFLTNDKSPETWLTCDVDGRAMGFCYATPEALAEGTWNVLAIAVLPGLQGTGAGGALTRHLETDLTARGQRILIADTSGTAEFAQTRDFYRKHGFIEEARIRDYWADGDDKVTFWKSLC